MAQVESVAAAIAAAHGNLPQVEAVAIAGSRIGGAPNPDSDIDLYVYSRAPLAMADRMAMAASFASRFEVGNDYWEPGDEWIDAQSGLHVDVMHRTPAWIEEQLERVLVRHEASLGYSTCFWHNVLHSRPLFDRGGWYRDLQTRAERQYPEPLQRAIIVRNHPILRGTLSSYLAQIERAVGRGDSVSVQHRITALLASYFDVLFALNALPHPGEKRLLQITIARCASVPPRLEKQVNALLRSAAPPASLEVIVRARALLDDLDRLLADEGLLPDNGGHREGGAA